MSCHVLADRFTFAWEQTSSKVRKQVTIQQVVSREAFWHVFCQTPITEGDFKCVLARNCERLNSYENRIFHRRSFAGVSCIVFFFCFGISDVFHIFSACVRVSRYILITCQPGVHLFILLCRIVPGIILCHATINDLVPFAFAVIVYPFSIADRI